MVLGSGECLIATTDLLALVEANIASVDPFEVSGFGDLFNCPLFLFGLVPNSLGCTRHLVYYIARPTNKWATSHATNE